MRGPFEKLRHDPTANALTRAEREKADSIQKDLIQVIIDCELMGFGFGLLMADYEEAKKTDPEAQRLLGSVPYHLAYQLAMTHAALILHDTDDLKNEILGFVCDEHEKYAYHAKATYDELKQQNPLVRDNMGSLTHMDDRKSPAVQMADLMAYETMRKAVRWLDGAVEETPQFMLLKERVYKIEVCNKVWFDHFIEVNRKQ